MVGPWTLAPHHDHLQYMHHVNLMQRGQNGGITRDQMLHLNTCIFTILNELRLEILTTIFISEDLEFPPKLVFNQGSKDFVEVKNFRLTL